MKAAAKAKGPPAFEPEIVALCCNWCGYAGADFAGVSRMQYPPNIRIIRLMCSGRVDQGHILSALQLGADGVLVVGCHPGDCHYMSGNNRAVEVVDSAKEILRALGMEDRLRLEWISASEGGKFAKTITEFTSQVRSLGPSPMKGTQRESPLATSERKRKHAPKERLEAIVEATRVYNCLECAKCAASCPVTRERSDYSPMLTVERALRGLSEEIEEDIGMWSCMTCSTCHSRCPSDVDYLGFVRQLREMGPPASSACSHGGVFTNIARMHSHEPVSQPGRLAWVGDDLRVEAKGDVVYFTGCAPYQEPIFKAYGSSPLAIARATVRVLNAAGITPVVMGDERCCGHDLVWSGEGDDTTGRLARLNLDAIRATGAKRVVFSCPECLATFARDYPRLLGEGALDGLELLHTTQLYAELIESGALGMDADGGDGGDRTPVTYQDPCRLGRYMGVYDAPRKALASIPGMDLRDMPSSRRNSVCCGVAAWLNCSNFTKRIQVERLREAVATGATTLATACPKCNIHLNCVLSEPENPSLPAKPGIVVKDVSVLMAEALDSMGVPR